MQSYQQCCESVGHVVSDISHDWWMFCEHRGMSLHMSQWTSKVTLECYNSGLAIPNLVGTILYVLQLVVESQSLILKREVWSTVQGIRRRKGS